MASSIDAIIWNRERRPRRQQAPQRHPAESRKNFLGQFFFEVENHTGDMTVDKHHDLLQPSLILPETTPPVQPTSSTPGKNFFDLPPELRLDIYEYFIASIQETLALHRCHRSIHAMQYALAHPDPAAPGVGIFAAIFRRHPGAQILRQHLATLLVCQEFHVEIGRRLYEVLSPWLQYFIVYNLEELQSLTALVKKYDLPHPKSVQLIIHSERFGLTLPVSKVFTPLQRAGVIPHNLSMSKFLRNDWIVEPTSPPSPADMDKRFGRFGRQDGIWMYRRATPRGGEKVCIIGPLTRLDLDGQGKERGKWDMMLEGDYEVGWRAWLRS